MLTQSEKKFIVKILFFSFIEFTEYIFYFDLSNFEKELDDIRLNFFACVRYFDLSNLSTLT